MAGAGHHAGAPQRAAGGKEAPGAGGERLGEGTRIAQQPGGPGVGFELGERAKPAARQAVERLQPEKRVERQREDEPLRIAPLPAPGCCTLGPLQ